MDPEINIFCRDMTADELGQMNAGFDQNSLEYGAAVQDSKRFGYTAYLDDQFIGCVSGLAYLNEGEYSGWFYLTDLYVEKAHRLTGIGKRLLVMLEQELARLGISNVYTWTAGYEAPGFYEKMGYTRFIELAKWYSSGHSRIGFQKRLKEAL